MIESSYHINTRPDVARLVPGHARVILDVGCGAGKLGQLLKEGNPTRTVCGIEHNPAVASAARQVLDDILVGDVSTLDLPYPAGSFDVIICADILEHLMDPGALLRRLRPLLQPEGCLIASIPNMRHYTVILRLVRRGWFYTDEGHFDRTHVRFFSLDSMKTLFTDTGFTVELSQPRIVASRKMRWANTLLRGRLTEFVAYQYLIRAIVSSTASHDPKG